MKTGEIQREMYNILSRNGLQQLGLFCYNGIWFWVGHKERATPVKSMADTYLVNTIVAMRTRHPEEPIGVLENEANKRGIRV